MSDDTLTVSRLRRANRAREQYNPLRGLTLSRAISLIEGFNRGEMADLQWAYFNAEQADPDTFALIERRTSAMVGLDWQIKRVPEPKRAKGWSQQLEDEQAAALREAYDRIQNMSEAISHLATATFRGFAHLEKHRSIDGQIIKLEPLDQWNVVRDGLYGPWKYNPSATSTTFAAIGDEYLLDPSRWVIREKRMHVDRIALIKYVRQSLGQKDWDAFVEIYGIPGVIVIGPPSVPKDQEAVYQQAAEDVAAGGSGVLPNGSTIHTSDAPRGVNPFRDHLRYLQEQLVLVGTGGLLTMLTESGSGTLAGGAHQSTFDAIARAEAQRISEVFQRAIDTEVLRHLFQNQPPLVYWQLSGQDKVDVNQVVDQIAKLSSAGLEVDASEASELTGFKLSRRAGAAPGLGGVLANRASAKPDPAEAQLPRLARAFAEDLQPLRKRIARLLQIKDAEILRNRLQALERELPQLLDDINADPESAKVLEDLLADATAQGVAKGAAGRQRKAKSK